ncbi:flavin reductase family protein [Nocardioides daeguensis]|uniref:Flavin reductase family protein n=1 Tax=Nocardioides daeguensis TaxID=908359 RepID=A0ABP6VNF1_9ACTN|nr:flavin reductase family protein [Nocardioides daeguensis]MBV6727409.1 flavin reductase family protein [Nocardioides daeguensis]MCR1775499.1 flavin reductase family protein [Nocardioides daeguensis]
MTGSLADQLKAGFRRHAAGVALVVGDASTGLVGATVSSLASVSVDPPLLSFSLARTSSVGPQLVGCDELSVFVLAATQVELAAAYADRDAERFTQEQGWVREGGRLLLPEAVTTFRGRPAHVIPAGGSWLVLLEVDRVELGPSAAPLVHHDRAYRVPAELPRSRVLRVAEG